MLRSHSALAIRAEDVADRCVRYELGFFLSSIASTCLVRARLFRGLAENSGKRSVILYARQNPLADGAFAGRKRSAVLHRIDALIPRFAAGAFLI